MARVDQLARHLRLLDALGQKRRGWTVDELVDELQCSRATVYRDLGVLRKARFPLTQETVNGDVRHRLVALTLDKVRLSHELSLSLFLARKALAPVAGTPPYIALDKLLRDLPPLAPEDADFTTVDSDAPSTEATAKSVNQAIAKKKRLRISYRGSKDIQPRLRVIEPVEIRAKEMFGYCTAWCLEANEWRTFKLARIHAAEVLSDAAKAHPEFNAEDVYRQAGLWTGDPFEVRVRVLPQKAAVAEEYPLGRGARTEPQPDGSVVVTASVTHPKEVLQWTLRWGAGAEVLSPPWVRRLVRDELATAADLYAAPNRVSQAS